VRSTIQVWSAVRVKGARAIVKAAGGPDFTPDSSSQFGDMIKLTSLATSSISGSNRILDVNIIGWTALRGFKSWPAGTPNEVGTTAPTFLFCCKDIPAIQPTPSACCRRFCDDKHL